MTIHAASKHIYQMLIAISLISLLAGCGGGGSSGPKKDSTPNAFSFTSVTNAEVSTDVTSAPVTVSGFNQSVSISATGGTYSIGGSAFTSTAGTVTNGQIVTVKVKSSDKTNTAVSATLTVGGVSGAFTVTTAPDVTPDAFTFTDAQNVGANSVNTSNEITVAGIDVAVPISITNGEYAINGGAYTNAAGTVSKDQKVIVRATALNQPSTEVTAALFIGGVTGNFVVKTKADNTAPTAQILFPPPVSMTEGNTILVRGSASDEFSAIASVKVNGVLATTTDGFKNWQASVPLIDTAAPVTTTTENILKVATEDSVGNKSDEAVQVLIRQAPIHSSFPNADNSFNWPWAAVIDKTGDRSRLLVTNANTNVLSIDLNTGERTVFASIPNCTSEGLAINTESKRMYLSCGSGQLGQVFDFNLLDVSQSQSHINSSYKRISYLSLDVIDGSTKIAAINETDGAIIIANDLFNSFNLLSDAVQQKPDTTNPINSSWAIAYDRVNKRYLVSDYSQQSIFSVDAVTGSRKVFSSNEVGTGPAFGPVDATYVSGIAIDESRKRALVVEAFSGKIFAIDLETGNRVLHSSVTSDNQFNDLNESYQIAILDPNSYAFVTAQSPKAVFAVDMVTGHRVVFSK